MKHINCIGCGTELTEANWYASRQRKNERNCITCHDMKRLRRKIRQKNYPTRLLARFFSKKAKKSFDKVEEGYVYVISNPSYPEWYKVGMAVDAVDRLSSYQTSSPFRDFKLVYERFFQNRRLAEQRCHLALMQVAKQWNGEWFKLSLNKVKQTIDSVEDTAPLPYSKEKEKYVQSGFPF